MIRELFVPLLNNAADDGALDAAVAIAGWRAAHVSALVTLEHPMPLATEWGYFPVEVSQLQLDAARTQAEALAARARERLARGGGGGEVRLTEVMLLWSEETAALHARHADLSVLGGPDPGQPTPRFALTFKSLLLQSGRPVLMVPIGATLAAPPKRVVLAWTPSREAARAVHDALPLLAPGTRVDVLMIDPQVTEGLHGAQPGADIARHLARHELEVNVVAVPTLGLSDGENLLRYVQDTGADLLVMGGYGHARWREALLGGTTRSVLDRARGPVLFAH